MSGAATGPVDKASLRADMKHALSEIAPLQRSMEEELVNAAIQGDPAWKHAHTVALYHNKRIEFSVTSIANAAFRADKRVAYPRIADMATGRLHFHEVRSWDDLAPGGFGLMEPKRDLHIIYPDEIDVAVIPGLAWTRLGERLGYGGGFYDRVMPHFKGHTWGVGFDCQLLPELPQEQHDQLVERLWMKGFLDELA